MNKQDENTTNQPRRGRPSLYTPDVAAEILQRLEDGESLKDISKSSHLPAASTVIGWVHDDREGFAERYARSREIGYEKHADELIEIADDGSNDWIESNDPENPGYRLNGEHISRSRLRIDTRKWILCKMLPKVYGEKSSVDLTSKGESITPRLVVPGPMDLASWQQQIDALKKAPTSSEEPAGDGDSDVSSDHPTTS